MVGCGKLTFVSAGSHLQPRCAPLVVGGGKLSPGIDDHEASGVAIVSSPANAADARAVSLLVHVWSHGASGNRWMGLRLRPTLVDGQMVLVVSQLFGLYVTADGSALISAVRLQFVLVGRRGRPFGVAPVTFGWRWRRLALASGKGAAGTSLCCFRLMSF